MFSEALHNVKGIFPRRLRYSVLYRVTPGNMVEFVNCSWLPPGNALWQPDW